MYADDTCLEFTSQKLSELVMKANQEIVKKIAWFSSFNMRINEIKTNYMNVQRHARKVP